MKAWIWHFSFLIMLLTGCQTSIFETNHVLDKDINSNKETIPVKPVPDYIGSTIPVPGATLALTEYEKLAADTGWAYEIPSVCFGLDAFLLMEPGDIFTSSDEWLPRVQLIVDDQTFTQYDSLLQADVKGSSKIDPTTGEVIWREPDGSPYGLCYGVELEPGYHTATISVEKTSGTQVTYTWPFTITE